MLFTPCTHHHLCHVVAWSESWSVFSMLSSRMPWNSTFAMSLSLVTSFPLKKGLAVHCRLWFYYIKNDSYWVDVFMRPLLICFWCFLTRDREATGYKKDTHISSTVSQTFVLLSSLLFFNCFMIFIQWTNSFRCSQKCQTFPFV